MFRLTSSSRRAVAPAFLLAVGLATPSPAVDPASVSGTVTVASGSPAAGVSVTLVERRDSTTTDESGRFLFEDVSPGAYLLEATSPRFGHSVARIEVLDGQAVVQDLRLDMDVFHEFVVVSARPGATRRGEVAQPVAVMDGDSLQLEMAPTLGETLDAVPGVNSTYFGPGSSRPIIRGLGGGRIRVLETASAASTPPPPAPTTR